MGTREESWPRNTPWLVIRVCSDSIEPNVSLDLLYRNRGEASGDESVKETKAKRGRYHHFYPGCIDILQRRLNQDTVKLGDKVPGL